MDGVFNVRRYCEGDEDALIELLTKSFPAWREGSSTSEFWNWKYKRNPLGFFPSTIGLVQHLDKLVAHFALIPRRVKIRNSVVLAGLMADATTHPDYRGQGLFMTLAEKVLTEIKNDGFKMAYAFGLGSRILTMKIPWTCARASYVQSSVSALRARSIKVPMQLVKVWNMKKIVKIFSRSNLLAQITDAGFEWLTRASDEKTSFASTVDYPGIRQVQSFDRRYDVFYTSASENYDVITERSSRYLNWRYIDTPSSMEYTVFSAEEENQIKGYIVLRCLNEQGLIVGNIVDILALPNRDEVVTLLISKSLKFFKARGVDLVRCLMLSSHPYYRILQDSGFLWPSSLFTKMFRSFVPSAVGGAHFFREIPCFNICINSPDADIIKTFSSWPSNRWFATYGDMG